MELASMLAGERFSDRPQCASPVIGAFLRTYNDAVGDARRQDLYRFAAMVVGSRASRQCERMRADMCVEWAYGLASDAGLRRWHLRRLARMGEMPGHSSLEDCGSMAARVAAASIRRRDDAAHARALAFVESLIDTVDRRDSLELTPEDQRRLPVGATS
jgi:hypothetical protein